MKIREFVKQHPLFISFTLIFICIFPVILLRGATPSNELRYLSIVDEAIQNGNLFTFTNHGIPYADKPPLYFWLLIICRQLFGAHVIPILTLFSLIPAFVIIWIMDKWTGIKSTFSRIAMALMLGTTGLFLGISVFLRMDMLMCMFIVLALYSFYIWYEDDKMRERQLIPADSRPKGKIQKWLFPFWIFMALFTKGPVGLLVPPLSILIFLLLKHEGKKVGKYLGWRTWGVILGCSSLWLLGVYIEGGNEYLNNLVVHQTVDRAVNAFHHNKPFWYYFTAIWYVTLPYCLLCIGTFIASMVSKKRKKSDKELLFQVVIASTILMLSCFSSKLTIYLAPIFPFLVYLFALVEHRIGWKKWMSWTLGIPSFLLFATGIGVLVCTSSPKLLTLLTEYIPPYPFIQSSMIKFGALLLIVGNVTAILWLIKGKAGIRSICMIATSILLTIYSVSYLFPQINIFTTYGPLCERIPENTEVATLYVHRPENMDVYLGREIVDYKKDPEQFLEQEIRHRTAADGPLSLIILTDKVNENSELADFLNTLDRSYCGQYVIYTYTPENK